MFIRLVPRYTVGTRMCALSSNVGRVFDRENWRVCVTMSDRERERETVRNTHTYLGKRERASVCRSLDKFISIQGLP